MHLPETTNEETLWRAVLSRDAAFNNHFVYGVTSTGIYCRPTCPSRRPQRERVRFYATPADAANAGFRPCQRCHPQGEVPEQHLAMVKEMCHLLAGDSGEIPTLAALGEHFHMSPYHLQRVFKRIVGVSPRHYADSHRRARLKQQLQEPETVTASIYATGYASSSTVYEQVDDLFGMTPTRYQRGGDGEEIAFTVTSSPLGYLLVAATERGLCAVRLGENGRALEQELRAEFPRAALHKNGTALRQYVTDILAYLEGTQPHLELPLDVRATAFQRQVWQALRTIPYGSTRSYRDVATTLGNPRAVRAVAQACKTNPVLLVVPCHRVIREDGSISGYRAGVERKEWLLAHEQSHMQQS